MGARLRLLGWVSLGAVLASAEATDAATLFSTESVVELDGTLYADDRILVDDGGVVQAPNVLPAFSESTDLIGYHASTAGFQLYALDTLRSLGGGISAAPGDVVELSGGLETLAFDASAEGVPIGVRTDAVTLDGAGDLVLSFDTTVDLGSGLVVGDEDLVVFDGSSFAAFFDGSIEGLDEALDLDGASYDTVSGRLLLSLDGSGSVGGVAFDDEDLLEFDTVSSAWTLAYDGSSEHAELAPVDVVAVPEPNRGVLLLFGAAGILGLSFHRSRRTHRDAGAL